MDITHLSLFSGIGGIDLAAEWAGIRTIGQCEWAEYPTKVLERHWPDVPRWKDIRTLTGESFYARTGRRTVDIISGGFPCQPFSIAGKRRGKEDDRYLWPEMVRVIKELRPAWIVGENVAGIIKMALPDILSELVGLGYRTRTFLIPACAVGARHRRYRVAIVAHTDVGRRIHGQDEVNTDERGRQTQHKTGKCGEDVANAKGERLQRIWEGGNKEFNVGFKEGKSKRCSNVSDTHNGLRERKRTIEPILGGMADGIPGWMDRDLDFLINHYWDEEPGIKRIASGITHRTDRIKCLGNAVVPQQFFPIFKAIKEIEDA